MAEGDLIDLLTFSNPTEKKDMDLATRALRREAASIGAHGVIVLKQGQVRVSSSATERRIVGAAIRNLDMGTTQDDGTEKYIVVEGGYCNENSDCVRGLSCNNHMCVWPAGFKRPTSAR